MSTDTKVWRLRKLAYFTISCSFDMINKSAKCVRLLYDRRGKYANHVINCDEWSNYDEQKWNIFIKNCCKGIL